ncbi:beta-N-acetylhexosaminidase [Amaricoccus macauensis]|uniref:beta-N-acetylhexosaminidase n=1 Tax=Amaricoccus macauensis TaxID=57001 RepID=UPI003C798C80
MSARAVILGCRGTSLSEAERAFYRSTDPWGFILFARNIDTPAQVRALTRDLREAVGRDAPILIDQEGGRVARMRGPHWREWLPALDDCARLPDLATRVQAMALRYRIIAGELRDVGIDVNCAPVLDLAGPETHQIIRNRCYGTDPEEVCAIGRGVAEGLMAGGVLPIIKHMPGQGRAPLDSHASVPVVRASRDALAQDFAAFRGLNDLPMAMTGHVIFEAFDAERPATLSPVMYRLMRKEIGFGGLIMTDDLSMHALTGPFGARVEAALGAGCDMILHCNGNAEEMAAVMEAAPQLSGLPLERAMAALAARQAPDERDVGALWAEFEALVGGVANA